MIVNTRTTVFLRQPFCSTPVSFSWFVFCFELCCLCVTTTARHFVFGCLRLLVQSVVLIDFCVVNPLWSLQYMQYPYIPVLRSAIGLSWLRFLGLLRFLILLLVCYHYRYHSVIGCLRLLVQHRLSCHFCIVNSRIIQYTATPSHSVLRHCWFISALFSWSASFLILRLVCYRLPLPSVIGRLRFLVQLHFLVLLLRC